MRKLIQIILFVAALSLSASELSEAVKAFENQDFKSAETQLLQLWDSGNQTDSIAYYLGRSYYQQENHKNAIHWLEKAVDLNDGSSLYHTWLGRALALKALRSNILTKARMAGKIKSEFLKAVQLDSTRLAARWDLFQFYMQAPGLLGGGTDKATDVANAIMRMDSLNGYFAIGQVMQRENAFDEAVALYTKGSQHYPDNQNLMLNLALSYFEKDQMDSTYLILQNYQLHHPDSLTTLYQIGRLASVTGLYLTEGENAMKHFLELLPDDDREWVAWAYYHLGSIHEKMEQKEEALSDYRLALTFQPDHEKADQALQELMKE